MERLKIRKLHTQPSENLCLADGEKRYRAMRAQETAEEQKARLVETASIVLQVQCMGLLDDNKHVHV